MRLYDYAASGNCYKVRLLLTLLDRHFERVPIDIFAGDTLTDQYGAVNPLHETPVLELDSGHRIAQSNAICWYLGEGTKFLPETPLARAEIVQWLFFEQEYVMSGIGSARFRMLTGRDPAGLPGRLETAAKALDVLEAHLAGRDFVVGANPTIADTAIFAYTHVAPGAGIDLGRFPAVSAWLARIECLPRFIDDLVPYPDNARPGQGRSIYD
jgi:glutathione S-transferase